MTPFALGLVLAAALLHAVWNVFAKRAGGGMAFVWLSFIATCVLYAPVVVIAIFVTHPHLTLVDDLFMLGNGALHVVYFLLLRRGYRDGDLSLVYPLARGTGPLLSSLCAIALLGERPSAVAIGGIVCIVAGVLLASGIRAVRDAQTRVSVFYGVATGAAIAAYTLWDKHAVSALALNPIVYDYGGNLARTAMMTPLMVPRLRAFGATLGMTDAGDIGAAWRAHKWDAIGIGLLSPLAYLLVLWALQWTPVSYVAPAREVSILFGTILGVKLFAERGRPQARLAAAGLMLIGIVALARG